MTEASPQERTYAMRLLPQQGQRGEIDGGDHSMVGHVRGYGRADRTRQKPNLLSPYRRDACKTSFWRARSRRRRRAPFCHRRVRLLCQGISAEELRQVHHAVFDPQNLDRFLLPPIKQ